MFYPHSSLILSHNFSHKSNLNLSTGPTYVKPQPTVAYANLNLRLSLLLNLAHGALVRANSATLARAEKENRSDTNDGSHYFCVFLILSGERRRPDASRVTASSRSTDVAAASCTATLCLDVVVGVTIAARHATTGTACAPPQGDLLTCLSILFKCSFRPNRSLRVGSGLCVGLAA